MKLLAGIEVHSDPALLFPLSAKVSHMKNLNKAKVKVSNRMRAAFLFSAIAISGVASAQTMVAVKNVTCSRINGSCGIEFYGRTDGMYAFRGGNAVIHAENPTYLLYRTYYSVGFSVLKRGNFSVCVSPTADGQFSWYGARCYYGTW